MYSSVELSTTTYVSNDNTGSYRRHLQTGTIGKGPRHSILSAASTLPGPGAFNRSDDVLSHWSHTSSVTFSRGPGHQSSIVKSMSPGPASYSPNDQMLAHHSRSPSATFGQATFRDLQCRNTLSPGPANFYADDRVEARHSRSTSVPIGRGPGHETFHDQPPKSPGPATYDADDRLLAGHRTFPACTIGHGPGHASSVVRDSSPAPGSYNVANRSFDSRLKRHAGTSLARTGRDRPTAEERLRFRRADQNSDGHLDITEMSSCMEARFPDIKSGEVYAIFNAADQNHDGKLDFHEILDYTHSTDPAQRRLREKMLMALAAPRCSASYREGQERMYFRKADTNLDGQLDVTEVESLMRHCFHDIKKRDVTDIFHAVDRNHDGKLDFQEVVNYTRSKDTSNRRLRDKLQTALAAPFTQSNGDALPINASGTSRPNSKQKAPSMRRASSASTVGSLIASHRNSA